MHQKNKLKCYHHQVCDSTTVERLVADLENSLDKYLMLYGKQYEEIRRKTKLNTDHMMALRHSCQTHIDYVIPINDPQKASEFTSFIAKECKLRGI
jgi:hypothetical protein